ncbi:MAG: outer membrane beta-barrel protein [Cytophagales bacterium]
MYSSIKCIATLILILLGLSCGFSQTYNYATSSVTYNSGIVKQGYILDTDLALLSVGIYFKENLNEEYILIPLDSIEKIQLNGNTYFEKYIDKKSNKAFLLLKMFDGEVSLYKFINNGKIRFLLKKDNSYYPISDKVRKAYDIGTYYRGVLTLLLSDWKDLELKLYSTRYNENQLIQLLNAYNLSRNLPGKSLKRKKQNSLGFHTGLHQNRIYFLFKSTIDGRISGLRTSGFGGLFIERKIGQNFGTQIGINYIQFKGELINIGAQDDYLKKNYDAKFTYISLPLHLNYYVLNKEMKILISGVFEYNNLVNQSFKVFIPKLNIENDVEFPEPGYHLRTNMGIALVYKGFIFQSLFCYGIGYSGIQPMIATWGNQVSLGYKLDL